MSKSISDKTVRNPSQSTPFSEILEKNMSRRMVMRGGLAATALTTLPAAIPAAELATAEAAAGRRRKRPFRAYSRKSYFKSKVLRAEVDASLRKVTGLIDEINRKWPFSRDSEIRLP